MPSYHSFLVNNSTEWDHYDPVTPVTRRSGTSSQAELPMITVKRPSTKDTPSGGARPVTSSSQRYSLRLRQEGVVRRATSYSERVAEARGGPSSPLELQAAVATEPVMQATSSSRGAPRPATPKPPSSQKSRASRASLPAQQAPQHCAPSLQAPVLQPQPNAWPQHEVASSNPAPDVPGTPIEIPQFSAESDIAHFDAAPYDEDLEEYPKDLPEQEQSVFSDHVSVGQNDIQLEVLNSQTPTPSNAIDKVWKELGNSPRVEEHRRSVLDNFDHFDTNHEGMIEFPEFQKACKAFRKNLTTSKMRKLFNDMDVDGVGAISIRDFMTSAHMGWDKHYQPTVGPVWERPGPGRSWANASSHSARRSVKDQVRRMHQRQVVSAGLSLALARAKLSGGAKSINSQQLSNAFRFFDTNRSGKISCDEFQAAFQHLNIPISRKALHDLLRCFDANEDGMIDYLEFADSFDSKNKISMYRPAELPRNTATCHAEIKGRNLPW